MVPSRQIEDMAYQHGLAHKPLADFADLPEVDAYIEAHTGNGARLPTDEWTAAYWRGVRSTWVRRWTTAPDDYDNFQTATVQVVPSAWCGKDLREVLIDPTYLEWHLCRYSSGLHGVWEEDPRVADQAAKTRHEAFKAEQEARKAARTAGLVWLEEASEDFLDRLNDGSVDSEEALQSRCLGWEEVRAEVTKRKRAVQEAKWNAEYAELAPMVEGRVLIFEPTTLGATFKVHYNAQVIQWGEHRGAMAKVHAGREFVGYLGGVVRYWRTKALGDAPPKKVLDKVGLSKIDGIKSVEVEGNLFWHYTDAWEKTSVYKENGQAVRDKLTLAKVDALIQFERSKGDFAAWRAVRLAVEALVGWGWACPTDLIGLALHIRDNLVDPGLLAAECKRVGAMLGVDPSRLQRSVEGLEPVMLNSVPRARKPNGSKQIKMKF